MIWSFRTRVSRIWGFEMNDRLQNAEKTSGFTINAHQKCLKFDDKTPKNALKFMQKMRQIFSELSVWRLRPKFYLKKPCVSLFVVGVLGADFAFGIDIPDHTLPNTITLRAGEQRTDTAISSPSGVWEANTFEYRDGSEGSNLTLNGGAGSKYTLKINDDKTTFYAKNFTIGQDTKLELNHFHTINFAGDVNVGANSEFTIINSGNTLTSAQGSEFGKRSKIRFGNKNTKFTLGENSKVLFTYTLFFMSDAEITLSTNSSLDIISANAARFQNTFTNNGGTVTFGGIVGNSMVKTNVYNIGSPASKDVNAKNTTATFTNNNGNITVNGDFYNGGKALTDISGAMIETFDPPFGGGGNLVLKGGTMRVTGKLVSQRGGTEYYGGELRDVQNSTISIYGATLIVGGGLENKQGSTITFGVLNGKMGELKGNLTNESGVVAVDIKGVNLGQNYQIISGTIKGLGNDDIQIINPNSQFFSTSFNNGTLTITKATNANGQTKFDEYKNGLNANLNSILNAMSFKFGDDDTLLTSDINLQTALADADKSVKDNLVSQPKNMLAAFKGDVLLAPMSQGRFVARRLAASGAVRFDNGRRVRALQAKPNVEFQLAPVGGVMKSADASGVLAGLSLGANYKMGAFTHKTSLAYAYGTAKQDLSTQSTETKAHLLQAGVLSLYKYGIYETEFNANLLFGSFTIDNKWTERSLNSSSKFNNYELNLGLVAGARYGKKLSFKPFVGVQNYGQRQDGFVGILGFESKAYNAYILDGVLGVQMQYVRSAFSSVYGKVSFERRLYNTHKFVFLRSGENELKYENQSYESVVSAALGAQLLTYKRFKLNAEGFLRHYDTGLNYYGGSLVMRYGF